MRLISNVGNAQVSGAGAPGCHIGNVLKIGSTATFVETSSAGALSRGVLVVLGVFDEVDLIEVGTCGLDNVDIMGSDGFMDDDAGLSIREFTHLYYMKIRTNK